MTHIQHNCPALRISLVLLLIFSAMLIHAQTTIEKKAGAWVLLVDGIPFDIKGVTFGYDQHTDQYDRYFEDLKFMGVNSIRTWGTDANTPLLMDAAHQHGIKVMLGIWMRHGRPGMEADDAFDYLKDTEGIESMYNNALAVVQQYKDHPALLSWGVGNEVYLNTATDEEKLAYSRLLERICASIKKTDPDHPITSVEAWTFGVDWWAQHVPSIDIYGINTYGAGANFLPEALSDKGVDKPYIITEFGVRGEWEIEKDKNGVVPEPSDAEKYETIVNGYHNWIKSKPACLGVYVFHYASGEQFVAPWLFTHFRKMTRPQYWAIREAFTGQKPVNEVPRVSVFQLTDDKIRSGTWIPVKLQAIDPEQENLSVDFYYNQRKGSRKLRDQLSPLNSRGSLEEGFEIMIPAVNGGIKVYAVVRDDYQNAGIATTSVSVKDKKEAKRKFLVPRPPLPFYVYHDNEALPYSPSAWMGNQKDLTIDLNCSENPKSGKTAIKISYNSKGGWYGIGFVDPPNDWGKLLGGYDLSGASSFSFWARASQDYLSVSAGFGLIEADQPFHDTDIKRIDISLTKEWKKYTIPIKRLDLSCIRSGFVLYSSGQGKPHEIFIDDIVFE